MDNDGGEKQRFPAEGQEARGQELVQREPVVPNEVDEVIQSERAGSTKAAVGLSDVLRQMGETYRSDPVVAVRGQAFIKLLHRYVGTQLAARLTKFAVRRKITVEFEPTILGSTKPKDVDVAVVDPDNGPLVLIGVRSQMSSVGKNVLTYYEGIVGECISLQDRFPMSTHAYIYLHPLTSIMEGKESESIDHGRYARMYVQMFASALALRPHAELNLRRFG